MNYFFAYFGSKKTHTMENNKLRQLLSNLESSDQIVEFVSIGKEMSNNLIGGRKAPSTNAGCSQNPTCSNNQSCAGNDSCSANEACSNNTVCNANATCN